MAREKFPEEMFELLGGMNSKASVYMNGPMEFRRIVNMHFTNPGALDSRPGSTLAVATALSGPVWSGTEFEKLSGASYLVVSALTELYQQVGSGYTTINQGLLNNGIFDFVPFTDNLFMANGQNFLKFTGSSVIPYGVPQASFGLAAISGYGASALGGSLAAGGTFTYAFAFVNSLGQMGPISEEYTVSSPTLFASYFRVPPIAQAASFGIQYIQMFRAVTGTDLAGVTNFAYNGSATTVITDVNYPNSDLVEPTNLFFTLVPEYLELYNNQLFMAGFSGAQSSFYWSDIGQPESVQPESFAEVRTNDGDELSGMKNIGSALIISKFRSLHKLTGDNPDNFLLQEITDQYGCLSNRSMVVFKNRLWCLDAAGILEYDGAQYQIVSSKIEDVFRRMNQPVAVDKAVAIHAREFNEVWFAIPCDGATFNNCVIVYDYDVDCWTTYEGWQIASLFQAKGENSLKPIHYGSMSGMVLQVSQSLTSDAGLAFTCSFEHAWVHPEGQTKQTMYRRFYMNVNPVMDPSANINLSFYTDYQASLALQTTISQAPFQSRIDFGINSRSIQAQMSYASATHQIQVYGFAYQWRFLRSV
jgi:hypothetical protein